MRLFFSLVAAFLFFGSFSSFADDRVQLNIRLLQASDKSLIGFNSFTDSSELEVNLSDLKQQLETLPFERYSMLIEKKITLPLKKQGTIELKDGQTLDIKPLHIDGNIVTVWMDWKDASGHCILDSRLHIDSSEAMLAGTDNSADSGLLLAINVNPIVKK